MPAHIVVVHDDHTLVDEVCAALRATGHQVAAFPDPLRAGNALKAGHSVDVLITRLSFAEGLSNGVSLAMMAINRRPTIKVLFVAREENRPHAQGIGEFLPMPAAVPDIVTAVERLLAAPSSRAG
jgi:DNA-binding NtrC family response regulator